MSHVYVFGAGASSEYRGVKGGFFVNGTFFDVVQAMWSGWLKGGGLVEFAPNHSHAPDHYDGGEWRWPALEKILVERCGAEYAKLGLEATYVAVSEIGEREALLYLRAIELALFHQLRAVSSANMPVHIEFVRKHLQPDDSIVTFNYDPLLEIAVRHVAREQGSQLRWYEGDGYGVRVIPMGAPPQEVQGQSNVLVLKLHGSVDWLYRTGEAPKPPFSALRAIPESFRGQGVIVHDGMRPMIVPPLPIKNYEQMGVAQLWARAEEALNDASGVTLIGYSLPESDTAARELLVRTSKGHSEKQATFVTRSDQSAFERFRSIYPDALLKTGGFRGFVDSVPAAGAG